MLITVLFPLAGGETLLCEMNGEIQRNIQTALYHFLTKSIHKSDFMCWYQQASDCFVSLGLWKEIGISP